MGGALAGIRVIDFGQYLAGPLTAMLLADQGAEVIHIDPPGGPRWRSDANSALNRGKRSIELDFADATDLGLVRRLIASADVVIENFRPGVMAGWGLDHASVASDNPGLLYCSLPGFAADDPRAPLPAWEGVIGAATSTYRAPRDATDGEPQYHALPYASSFAALQAANAITFALVDRFRGGTGQHIEVPLYDAMFAAIGGHGLQIGGQPMGGRPDDFWIGVFPCADGRFVHFQAASPRFRQRFVAAVGRPDWEPDPAVLAKDPERRRRQYDELRELFTTRTADEWEQLGADADVTLLKIRTAAEWLREPHALDAGAVVELHDPRLGEVLQAGRAVHLEQSGAPDLRAETALTRDAAEQLARRTPSSAAVAGDAPRAPLHGVRVLDVSQVLAGPTTGRTLAEFGAEVIKVNDPYEQGAGWSTSVHRYHTDVNRGKRSVLLDLKTPAGQETFWRIAGEVDVIVHNFREGVPERLGLDRERALREGRNPIIVSMNAYGRPGPWSRRPGYEPFGQAATGLSERTGGDRPAMAPYAVNDYGTGLLGAFGAALALLHRTRTGAVIDAHASLAYTATFLQTVFMLAHEGASPPEPRGPQAKGSGPLHRLYRASDAWFFLGARADQRPAIATTTGVDGAGELSDGELEAALAERFTHRTAAEWVDALIDSGVGAHELAELSAIMTDARNVARGVSVTRPHDTGEVITTIGPGTRLSNGIIVPGAPASSPGADGWNLLESNGIPAEQIRALIDQGVLVTPTVVAARRERLVPAD